MPTTYLPAEDHIARHVKAKLVMRDDDRRPVGIFPEAFDLRECEDYLSVSWLEHFEGDRAQRMRKVVEHSELKLRPSHGFGIVQVEVLSRVCADHGNKVRVIHEPTDINPAHAGIHRYPRDNAALNAELANLAGQGLVMVGDIDRGSV